MTIVNGTPGNDVIDMVAEGAVPTSAPGSEDYIYAGDGDDRVIVTQNQPQIPFAYSGLAGVYDYIYGGNGVDTLQMTIMYTDAINSLTFSADPNGGLSGVYTWNFNWTNPTTGVSGVSSAAGFYFYNFENFDLTMQTDLDIATGSGDDVVRALHDHSVAMGAGNDTLHIDHGGSAYGTSLTATGSLAAGYSGTAYNAAFGTISFSGVENFNLDLSAAADVVTLGDGNDVVLANAGNDRIHVAAGVNDVNGGAGFDQLSIDLSGQASGVAIDLTIASGAQQSSGVGSVEAFESFDTFVGSDFGDTILESDSTTNTNGNFDMGDGDDYLRVSRGTDVIEGGAGSDRLAIDHSTSAYGSYYTEDFLGTFAGGYQGEWYNAGYGRFTFSGIEHFDLTGGNAADTLTAGDGDDNLWANSGNDLITAGMGNDNVDGGAGFDRLSINLSDETGGITIDLSQAGAQQSGGSGSVTGVESFGVVVGSAFNDVLVETDSTINTNGNFNLGDGNDYLRVSRGTDIIEGGAGSDRLAIDFTASAYGGAYTENFTGTFAGGYEGEWYNAGYGRFTFSGIEHFDLTGGNAADTLTAGDGDDNLWANSGNDLITAGMGNDNVDGGAGFDRLSINLSDETGGVTIDLSQAGAQQSGGSGSVTGIESFGVVVGSAFDDTIIETGSTINTNGNFNLGAGNDYLRLSQGTDVVEGGSGSDRLVIDHNDSAYGSYYTVAFSGTLAGGYAGEFYNASHGRFTFGGIEHFDLIGGSGNDTLRGGEGDDNLWGNNGNDLLFAGGGVNTVDGGAAGFDQLSIDFSGATAGVHLDLSVAGAQLLAGPGSVTGIESFGTVIGSAFDDIFIDTAVTTNSNSTINTGAGNDYVRTFDGSDSINMGSGSDRLAVDYGGSAYGGYFNTAITGTFASGYAGSIYNAARGSTSFTGVEHFDLIGGNGADDFVTGGGNDNIDTRLGADYVNSGAGNDAVLLISNGSSADGGTGVDTIDLSGRDGGGGAHTINGRTGMWQGATQRMTLLNFENVIGMNNSHDTITGSSLANTLSGLSGNDVLNGAAGNDVLLGGEGNDSLNGGTGVDAMTGWLGDDIYYLDNAGDTITEALGEGLDEVRASIDYTLGDHVEDLRLQGGARAGTGNALDNVIFAGAGPVTLAGMDGNDTLWGSAASDTLTGGQGDDITYGRNGNDTIDGGDGNDTLRGEIGSDILTGGLGADSLFGGDGIDSLHGGEGDDILRGEAQNDTLYGEAGADTLQGGDGNDNLYGGAGRDVMTGGLGNDGFWFADGDFAGLTNATADRITDFAQGFDRIRLSAVDANSSQAGDQAFAFIGASAFSNTAGELRYTQAGGVTLIEGDTNGDGVVDFAIALTGSINLLAADFVL